MELVQSNKDRDLEFKDLSDNVIRAAENLLLDRNLPKEIDVPVEAQFTHVKLQGQDCTKVLFHDGHIIYKGIHHLPPNLKVRWKLSRITENGKIFAAMNFHIQDNSHVFVIAEESVKNPTLEITLSFLSDEVEIGNIGKLEKPLIDTDRKLAAANLEALTRWEVKARGEEIRNLIRTALERTQRRIIPKK